MALLHRQQNISPATVWLVVLLSLFALCALSAPVISGEPESSGHAVIEAGIDHYRNGNFALAIASWNNALQLARKQNDKVLEVDARLRLAEAYQVLGQHIHAIEILEPIVSRVDQSTDPYHHMQLTVVLGRSYAETGDIEQAKALLEESASAAAISGNQELAATALNNLANLFTRQRQYLDAMEAYEKARELAKRSDNRLLHGQVSANAARAALEKGNLDRAGELLLVALEEARALSNSHDKAYLLLNIGQLTRRLPNNGIDANRKRHIEVYDVFREAQTVAVSIGDHRALSYALGYQGQLYQSAERFQEAIRLTDRAIFSAQQADAPEALYRWQWQKGQLLRSEADIENAIASYRAAVSTLQTIRSDLSLRYARGQASYRDIIGPLFFELADLLLQRTRTVADKEAIQNDLEAAREVIEQSKAVELEDYFQDDCVTELLAKRTRLDEVADRTAIIYPILLKDRLELLLSLPDGIRQFTVAVPRARITEEIRDMRKRLEKRTSNQYLLHARQLYNWLIQPLAQNLERAGIDTLVVVPDGPLRTIPFGALHDGNEFLIARYALAYTPGLLLTDPHPLKRDNVRVLLNGLTKPVQDFPALPYVSGELKLVHDTYGGRILLDENYIVNNVRDELESASYTVVHIASHGQFSGDHRKTFILAYDNKVTLDRLEQLMGISRHRDDPVELLTLSACQTAAGDDRAALGLAGIAVKAGARSALASLWFINDQATSLLVSDFYRQLKNPGISKAKALQQAQINALADQRYRHPGYWSPFLLIGNWL